MLPAKNSSYQSFSQPDCDPARLRTVSSAAPNLHKLPTVVPAPSEEPHCVAISFAVNDEYDVNQARKDLVSMVSHDLRSPLTALRVSVGMFLGGAFGDMTPEATRRLESMGSSVDLLIRMINDLLDVERLEAGQFHFYVKPADSHHLVKSAIQAVSGIAEVKGIEFKIVGKKLTLDVDSDRVIQVLINLLSNAIKFSPAHSQIEVHVSSRNGSVEFRVVDRGRGIPAAKLSGVFRPYEQVGSHADIERMGSGLGLTIAKRIIEAHGGTIGVDSEVGKGSQFWIRLKAKRA
jgi:signal transduction histidine kinase